MQSMYQKCEDANANDPEIVALLIKVCSMFSAVHNMAWLEWGSDLMPEMWKALAEDECQAEIHHQAHDHVEQLQLFKDWVDMYLVCRVALEKEMMEPGADLEWLEGEFCTIDEVEKVDKATECELKNERLKLVCLVQGLLEGDDIDMED